MTSDRRDDQLSKLRQLSAEYAEFASCISDQIKTIEEQLKALPGKIPVSVSGEGYSLIFDRSSSGWELFLDPNVEELARVVLRSAPVAMKLVGAKLIGRLLDKLESAFRDALVAKENLQPVIDSLNTNEAARLVLGSFLKSQRRQSKQGDELIEPSHTLSPGAAAQLRKIAARTVSQAKSLTPPQPGGEVNDDPF